ncbi:MAG: hypothetical protein HZC49_10360 [Nitrospirae bacterium]|nr:hypothetical protein [Nitrospirota bacterium]
MAGDLSFTNFKRMEAYSYHDRLKEREYRGRQIGYRAMNILLAVIITTVLVLTWMNTGQAASTESQEWRYFSESGEPPQKWNHEEFDDSRWIKKQNGTGYGTRHSVFSIGDMKGKYMRVYARRLFIVTNPRRIVKMGLSVVCDGPFVAYLNGMPAIRNVMGLSKANPSGGSPIGEELDLSGWAHELNTGLNVLAIQCDNDDINSNDFLFIPSLKIIEGNGVK